MTTPKPPSTLAAIFANVLPLAIAYALMSGLIAVGNATGTRWLLLNGAELIAAAVGLGLAWRLRGRIAGFVLCGVAVYSAAMFAVHVGIDERAAQGGPVHIAVMGAAFVGVAVGALFLKAAPPQTTAIE